jgi:hypothetical protein
MMTFPSHIVADVARSWGPEPSADELARRARAADIEAYGHLSDALAHRAFKHAEPGPAQLEPTTLDPALFDVTPPEPAPEAGSNVVSLDAFRAAQRARATSMRAISSLAAVTTTSKR